MAGVAGTSTALESPVARLGRRARLSSCRTLVGLARGAGQMLSRLGAGFLLRGSWGPPPLALHSVFEPAIEELERLCLRSRSLLFADWKYEAEIRSVVDAALQQHLSELA